ncbi:calmodulin-interacting protein 111-like [Mangifera indica]|uniref:calmodulin-interacting protein 111-like n=1 Tax=Mangifera indica TaxID=29780 RepID=UPI001CFB0321|nr:calmodulin-interacting protein 111-like [Mangifera indica]
MHRGKNARGRRIPAGEKGQRSRPNAAAPLEPGENCGKPSSGGRLSKSLQQKFIGGRLVVAANIARPVTFSGYISDMLCATHASTGKVMINLEMGTYRKKKKLGNGILSSSNLGLRPTRGVLLHGPPGTGKTSLAQLCAHDAGVNLFTINGPEKASQNYGESEIAMHGVFESASKAAPAMVFIDELDAIAPARKDEGEELSQRMVATLLNLIDEISRTDGLVVIAATNRPNSIEPAVRRPGRLDREIELDFA